MSAPTTKDIFDGVLALVKRSYLEVFNVSVKSKTVEESGTEEGTDSKSVLSEPVSETKVSTKDQSASLTETVRESIQSGDEVALTPGIKREIETKFPYALGAVCSNLGALDALYRSAHGIEGQAEFSHFYIDVADEFPLCEAFASPCMMFVASMMLLDVDEKKSDAFYDKYALLVRRIADSLPLECAPTVEKYPY